MSAVPAHPEIHLDPGRLCATRRGRTMAVQEGEMAEAIARRRNRRLELRTTEEERALIDRAVAAAGMDLTEFVVSHASIAARRVLADRQEFALDDQALQEWERLNSAPARELPGLAALFSRPSPFAE